MSAASEHEGPVRVKAVVIDPQSMAVIWGNESAFESLAGDNTVAGGGASVEEVFPMAEAMGVPDALRAVATTGGSRHLRAALVSSARGTVALVISIYRLPGGMLLLLAEHGWEARHDTSESTSAGVRRPRRRNMQE